MSFVGDLFILSAFICAAASMVFYIMVWRGKSSVIQLGRNFFKTSSFFITASITMLLYMILTHDFTNMYVFSYSSTDLPLGYLISSLWGGQEGTFLLWLFFTVIMGWVMMKTAGDFEIGNMVFLNLFLISILLIIIVKSPFELMPVFRSEGAGLNPLLQNFWMQIHPPLMFVGFSGALFPFIFAMTALVERKYDTWAEAARKWTMFAWIMLGVSLVMGGYWAYVTLGWGGFWAWDPVENSSFIPWIFLAAQVHVLFIKRNRRGLMRFSLFMVSLTFWSVLYGTFLTRSGVLADFSVHSFVDLGINGYLISGLITFVVLGLALIIYRWNDINPNKSFSSIFSRHYLLTLGVIVMFVGGLLTLLGTSSPLLTRFNENPSAVGLDYYFTTMTPVAIVVMLLLGLFPAFRWNNGISRPAMIIISSAVGVVTALTLLATGFTSEIIYLVFFGSAAMTLVSNGYVLVSSFAQKNFQPAYLSHVGLALALIGAAVSAGFETKKMIKLPRNESVNEMGYDLRFVNTVDTHEGFDCHVEISNESDNFTAVLPHVIPNNQEGIMRKPHVEKYISFDLYVAPVSMEQSDNQANNFLTFQKGETHSIDKYEFTFHEFEMSSHEEEGQTSAAAVLTVSYDGKSEEIKPIITVESDSVATLPASFDYNNGAVIIAGIDPETGGLALEVMGDFVSSGEPTETVLVIELSEKPLINLFWLGTTLCFLSGALSIRSRRRRMRASLPDSDALKEKSQNEKSVA